MTKNVIDIHLEEDLSLRIRTGEDYPEGGNHFCYVDILRSDDQIASINSPSKPWENFTRAMVSQIIAKRIDRYSSSDEVDDLIQSEFKRQKSELDEVYGWE